MVMWDFKGRTDPLIFQHLHQKSSLLQHNILSWSRNRTHFTSLTYTDILNLCLLGFTPCLPTNKTRCGLKEESLDIEALYSCILARLEFVQFATCRHWMHDTSCLSKVLNELGSFQRAWIPSLSAEWSLQNWTDWYLHWAGGWRRGCWSWSVDTPYRVSRHLLTPNSKPKTEVCHK